MPFWLRAWRQARLGPSPVHLAFSLPATTALSRRLLNLQGPQPRVFATALEARMTTAERMPHADRLQTRLAPQPASIKAARPHRSTFQPVRVIKTLVSISEPV